MVRNENYLCFRSAVPKLFLAPGTDFTEDSFYTDQGWGRGDGQAQGPLVSRTAPPLETSPPSSHRCVQGSPALCLHAHLLLTNYSC